MNTHSMQIPKIIHQIWSGIDGLLPSRLKQFGDTWKHHHPEWQYEFWDNQRMNDFVQTHYPQYWNTYSTFPYNIHRWDSIRYLILEKIGGIYADFDTECFKPLDELLKEKQCCFSLEPEENARSLNLPFIFNNALMASVPNHPFMKEIVKVVFQQGISIPQNLPAHKKTYDVLQTTGPLMLVNLYKTYSDKESIYLIPAIYTSPLVKSDCMKYLRGKRTEYLQEKLENAYALHYFLNTWIPALM